MCLWVGETRPPGHNPGFILRFARVAAAGKAGQCDAQSVSPGQPPERAPLPPRGTKNTAERENKMKVGLEIFPLICYNWKEAERSGVFGSKRGEYPLKGREEL